MLRSNHYSPNYAGECLLKEAVLMRKGLKAYIRYLWKGNNPAVIESRTMELVRINNLDYKSLRDEYSNHKDMIKKIQNETLLK